MNLNFKKPDWFRSVVVSTRRFFERDALLIILFLLPWQARYIFGTVSYSQGVDGEYGVLSLYAVEVFIWLVFFFGGFWKRVNREMKIAVGVTIIWMALMAFFVSQPLILLNQFVHLLSAVALLLMIVWYAFSIRRLLFAFCAGVSGSALIGFFQVIFGFSPASTLLGLASRDVGRLGDSVVELGTMQRVLRAYGSFAHPNIFGGYLAVCLASIGGLFFFTKKRLVFVPMLLFFGSALLVTFSRSAWLGVLAAFGCLTIVALVRVKRIQVVAQSGFLMCLLVGSLIASFGLDLAVRPGSSAQFEERSVNERVVQYREFPSIVGTTMLLGMGLGQYTFERDRLHVVQNAWEHQPLHNVYLLALFEVGILPFLLLMLVFGKRVWIFFTKHARGVFLVAALLPIALYDHYLFSQWAGMVLVAVAFGLFARSGEFFREKSN